ncbi:hypothetical protein ZIOFF_047615 [Zingiber officinale]|uniref:Pseudouridine-5'-phosphate glycosidase n=1 Tax=Zingiber officinale TaxID=94328 RepID=A0A8J5KTT5_ZINOF|nr:hypothetical protein ZIOFF_047615 [Zingiber officinale]
MPELPPLRRPPLPRCPVPRESHFLSFSRRFDSARERRPCGALTSASLAEHWELHAVWSRMEQNDSILGSLKIAPDVNDALLCGNPVVALESTIISHGMPYPQNLQTAKEVQAILKANGAVPATIAILDGVPCIAIGERWYVTSKGLLEELQRVEINGAIVDGFATVELLGISVGLEGQGGVSTRGRAHEGIEGREGVAVVIDDKESGPTRGLNNEQLERLAKLGSKAQKTARRDISHVVPWRFWLVAMSRGGLFLITLFMFLHLSAMKDVGFLDVASGGNGATTVSATMFFASKVGIPVFVTGGVGGVHRHAETTMDISSDLTELGKTPMAVISAGVKSILDIPRTLEYLETQGVTVAVYQSNDFPAFFSGSSGCKVAWNGGRAITGNDVVACEVDSFSCSTTAGPVIGTGPREAPSTTCPLAVAVPCRLDTPEQCARLIYANMKLGLGSGMLIAVPAPEEHVAAGNAIESAIKKALEEAKVKNVAGNAATPFLLSRVNELTGGASLLASILL